MSKDNKKNEKTVSKASEKVVTPKMTEPEFYIYQLREHSQKEFRVKSEVLDGALFDYTKSKITKSEAQKRIDSFLKREVK